MRVAKCFRILGTIIVIMVIFMCIPFVVPKVIGVNAYEVVTSSMAPELPVGSVVYVQTCKADEVKVGDIISFYVGTDEENIISHRVVEINVDEQGDFFFITKGDANSDIDSMQVDVKHFVGKVKFKINNISWLVRLFDTSTGIIILIGLIIISLCLNIASDLINKKVSSESNNSSNNSSNKSKSIKKINKRNNFIIIFSVILILVALYNIIDIMNDYRKSEDLYTKLNEEYIFERSKEDKESSSKWYEDISVDFDSLKKINSDIVGWINFENNDISYPVLYSGDDDKYLRKSFDGEDATAGSIFVEGANNSDFEDKNTIIYGHNMRNLSMFGKLKKYTREQDYYDNNKYIQIITPNMYYRYEIFAYESVNEDSNVYQISFEDDAAIESYINKIRELSERQTDIDVSVDDKIITLSTCSTLSNHKRFVVHAVRVDEHKQ